MDKEYELKYHLNEEKNWWFVARRNAILAMVKDYNRDIKILDIGCAGGPLLKELMEAGFKNVYGIDFSEAAIDLCKKRNLENVFVMDAHQPEFEGETFDLVIASDCLEHLKDDETALSQWNRILKKEGQAIIFVPAFQFLWSTHDEVNQHFRRYTKENLNKKIEHAGFNIIGSSYWNFFLFFPVTIIRTLQSAFKPKKNSASGQIAELNPVLNWFLIFFFKFENFIFKKIGFPFGVSVFSIAKK